MPLSHLFKDFEDPFQYSQTEIENIVADLERDLFSMEEAILATKTRINRRKKDIESVEQEISRLSKHTKDGVTDLGLYRKARAIPDLREDLQDMLLTQKEETETLEYYNKLKADLKSLIKKGDEIMEIERVIPFKKENNNG